MPRSGAEVPTVQRSADMSRDGIGGEVNRQWTVKSILHK